MPAACSRSARDGATEDVVRRRLRTWGVAGTGLDPARLNDVLRNVYVGADPPEMYEISPEALTCGPRRRLTEARARGDALPPSVCDPAHPSNPTPAHLRDALEQGGMTDVTPGLIEVILLKFRDGRMRPSRLGFDDAVLTCPALSSAGGRWMCSLAR